MGYDENSPAYLVYHLEAGKIMKHRLVKLLRILMQNKVHKQKLPVKTSAVSDCQWVLL